MSEQGSPVKAPQQYEHCPDMKNRTEMRLLYVVLLLVLTMSVTEN